MEVAGQLPLTPRSIPFSTVDGIPLFLGPSQMLLKTSRMLHNKHVFQLFNPAIEPFIRELRDCSGTLLLHGIDHFMRSALSKEQAVLTMYLLAVVCDAVDKFPVPSNQVEEMVDHLRSVLISYLHVQCTRYFAKRHSKSETTRTHWSPIVEPLDVTAAWLLSFPAISTTTLPSYRKKFPWHVSQALKALKYDHKLMEDAKQSAPLRHVDGYLNEDVQLGYYFLAHSILPEMLKLLDYSSESLVTELLSFEKQMDIGVSSLVLRFEYQRLIKDAMTSQGSEDLHPDKMRFREIFKNHFNVVVDIWMYGAQIEQLPGVRPVMNKVIFHLVLTYSLGLYRDFVLSWGQGQSKSMDWVITQRFTRLSAEAFAIKLWITKELLKLNGHESLSGLPRSVLILTLGSGGDHESLNKFELKKGYGSIERLQQAEELTSEFEALVERGNVYQTLVQIYGILEGFDDGGKEVSE